MCTPSLMKLEALVAQICLEHNFITKLDADVDIDAEYIAGTSNIPVFPAS